MWQSMAGVWGIPSALISVVSYSIRALGGNGHSLRNQSESDILQMGDIEKRRLSLEFCPGFQPVADFGRPSKETPQRSQSSS